MPAGPDWHQAAMALEIERIRPAVQSAETVRGLRRLLGFRHFFRHAYGIARDPVRVESVRAAALAVRRHVREDFQRLDDVLRAIADEAHR